MHRISVAGLLWEVTAELAWLGLSVVGPTQEVAYLRAGGLRAELAGTAAHLVLDLELKHLQVGCLPTSMPAWGLPALSLLLKLSCPFPRLLLGQHLPYLF